LGEIFAEKLGSPNGPLSPMAPEIAHPASETAAVREEFERALLAEQPSVIDELISPKSRSREKFNELEGMACDFFVEKILNMGKEDKEVLLKMSYSERKEKVRLIFADMVTCEEMGTVSERETFRALANKAQRELEQHLFRVAGQYLSVLVQVIFGKHSKAALLQAWLPWKEKFAIWWEETRIAREKELARRKARAEAWYAFGERVMEERHKFLKIVMDSVADSRRQQIARQKQWEEEEEEVALENEAKEARRRDMAEAQKARQAAMQQERQMKAAEERARAEAAERALYDKLTSPPQSPQ